MANIKIPQKKYLDLIKENVELKAYIQELIDLDKNSSGIGISWQSFGEMVKENIRTKAIKFTENG